eukprot:12820734-Heterocapsa_arctica.AAC.1
MHKAWAQHFDQKDKGKPALGAPHIHVWAALVQQIIRDKAAAPGDLEIITAHAKVAVARAGNSPVCLFCDRCYEHFGIQL